MKGDTLRLIAVAIGLAVVVASGIWLTQAGRPYGGLLINVHKLVDLAVVVVIGIAAYQASKAASLSGGMWTLLGVAIVAVVVALVSGGVVSGMKDAPASALWIHRVGSWLAVALTAASAWSVLPR